LASERGLAHAASARLCDNGMIEVGGHPISQAPDYESGHGWLGAAEIVVATMNEFRPSVAAMPVVMLSLADPVGALGEYRAVLRCGGSAT
jgi:hypothetical protein